MDLEIFETKDGSHTLYSPQFNEIYHSRNGALAESTHIFINSGLANCNKQTINIFEVGFGTGLNAFLTWIFAESKCVKINYGSIELYPLAAELVLKINYPNILGAAEKFNQLHNAPWNKNVSLSPGFSLHKINASLLAFNQPLQGIDIIYFDAFSPEKQPELWTAEVFAKMYNLLANGGFLLTYCSKSTIRHNMEQAGFKVEKLPGPYGKREMVRAYKAIQVFKL